jgi:hypothetical protein
MLPPTRFTFEQARALLPWLKELCTEVENNLLRIDRLDANEAAAAQTKILNHWAETVSKLGALAKQPFVVDFDSGSDFFCWEYPEEDLYYRHDYQAGYMGRKPIQPGPQEKEKIP